MKKTVLRRYARLIARCGVNLQKGQEVRITAELDQPEFIRLLVDECYRAGASRVDVDWNDQACSRLHAKYRSLEILSALTEEEEARWKHAAQAYPARIYLASADPAGMKGTDQAKLAKARQQKYPLIKAYRDALSNHEQWCIAAVPGKAWAKRLFPAERPARAVELLWDAILTASRVTDDPIAAWNAHNEDLKARCAYLNSLGIRHMHYTAGNGTDFTVELIPEGIFCGGGETSLEGVFFDPNIPTEECFTSPMRGKAEGIVYATKPLSYQGELIEGFSIRFEGGKAVEWHAEKGEEALTHIITADEGSAYLGECALVPWDSPINQTGLLFLNTLFDENACCHLALGRGFPDCIRDFASRSLEEIHALGVNDSMMHVDFMIGAPDLRITAHTADGRDVLLFDRGGWAF